MILDAFGAFYNAHFMFKQHHFYVDQCCVQDLKNATMFNTVQQCSFNFDFIRLRVIHRLMPKLARAGIVVQSYSDNTVQCHTRPLNATT